MASLDEAFPIIDVPDLSPVDPREPFHDDAERVYRLVGSPRRGGRA